MSDKTDTPRTDKAIRRLMECGDGGMDLQTFARQLERELTEAEAKHAETIGEIFRNEVVPLKQQLAEAGKEIPKVRELLEDVVHDHANLDSSGYNDCDEDPCLWCICAKEVLSNLPQPKGGER